MKCMVTPYSSIALPHDNHSVLITFMNCACFAVQIHALVDSIHVGTIYHPWTIVHNIIKPLCSRKVIEVLTGLVYF